MLAIQANEQGHPIVIELNAEQKKFVAVDSDRWREILSEGDIDKTPQAIIPIELLDTFEPWMFNSMQQIDEAVQATKEALEACTNVLKVVVDTYH